MCEVYNGALSVAVEQNVGLTVNQYRPFDLVTPIVVVRHAPETGFNTTNHQRDVSVGFSGPLTVNRHRAIRSFPGNIARGVSVVVTTFAVSRVVIDHRVHVARGNTEE